MIVEFSTEALKKEADVAVEAVTKLAYSTVNSVANLCQKIEAYEKFEAMYLEAKNNKSIYQDQPVEESRLRSVLHG